MPEAVGNGTPSPFQPLLLDPLLLIQSVHHPNIFLSISLFIYYGLFFFFYHPQCYNKLDLVRNLVSFTVIFLEPRKKSGMYSVFVEPENK